MREKTKVQSTKNKKIKQKRSNIFYIINIDNSNSSRSSSILLQKE